MLKIFSFIIKNIKKNTLLDLINKLPLPEETAPICSHVYNFDDDAHAIDTRDNFIKLSSISFKYEVSISTQEIVIDAEDSIKAIQKYPLTNEHRFINK